MPLSDAFIRAVKAASTAKKYADSGGLYLHVSPAGGKLWRMAYRFDGKQKTLSFGAWPAVSLKEARTLRDDAKAVLASGIDPAEQKKSEKVGRHGRKKRRHSPLKWWLCSGFIKEKTANQSITSTCSPIG
jgi:hypothetical protein